MTNKVVSDHLNLEKRVRRKKIVIVVALAFLGACGSELSEGLVQHDPRDVARLNREIDVAISHQANVDELQNLLSARKVIMLELASKNPKEFLSSVLPDSTLQKLPISLQTLTEKKLSQVTGSLEVEVNDDFEHQKSTTQYFLRRTLERNELHVDGTLKAISGQEVTLNAYLLSGTLVASSTEIRSANIDAVTPLIGTQKLLVILIEYLDSPTEPFTRARANSLVFEGAFPSFILETSHGKANYSGRVTKWIRLPSNGPTNSMGTCRNGNLFDPAVTQELAAEGIDLSDYQAVTFLVNHPSVTGGCANLGKSVQYDANHNSYVLSMSWIGLVNYDQQHWVNPPFSFTNLDFMLSHEVAGHGWGIPHSNGWECGIGMIYGSQTLCSNAEYGGADVMANGSLGEHFNGLYQERLGWMDADSVTTITSTGTYTLARLESDTGVRMAKILDPIKGKDLFVIEYRRPTGYDGVLSYSDRKANAKGLFVYFVNDDADYDPVEMLDMTPIRTGWGTTDENWVSDGLLVSLTKDSTLSGKAFKDPITGITIGPVVSQDKSEIKFKVTFP